MHILNPTRDSLSVKGLSGNRISDAAEIECFSCERFFDEEEIGWILAHPNGYGLCVVNFKITVAYLLYLQGNGKIHLTNLVVHEDWRKQGVGTILIEQMKKRSNYISAVIRERNPSAQIFLKKNGFSAVGIFKNHFKDKYPDKIEKQDGYVFEFKNKGKIVV